MSNEDFARNPNTPPEALAMLSTSPSAAVRQLVALNPSTPKAALRFLAQDAERAVREAVAQNPMTPYDAFAAKEAAPPPVSVPMTSAAEAADELAPAQGETAQPDVQNNTSQDIPEAHFAPAAPRARSLWQRLLALLGLRAT